jgi:quinol monooxygenase YgiN
MGLPFTILVTIRIDPGRMSDFLAALRDVLTPARNEATNILLYAHTLDEDAGTVVLFERWLDYDVYLNEVLQTAHYRRYVELSEPLYIVPRKVLFLTPIDSYSASLLGNEHPS